jgi:hypothetical protein
MVDVISMSTLAELTEEDLDADPLLVLPCGHALLTSSADGEFGLRSFYAEDSATGWYVCRCDSCIAPQRAKLYGCDM